MLYKLLDIETYIQNVRWVAATAIFIATAAWAVELMDWTYICPFCRTQRTVIGILGILLFFPAPLHWIARYVGTTLGILGLVVAGTQHFRGWARISAGEFSFNQPIYFDSFLLSGAALFIITGLMFLLFLADKPKGLIEAPKVI
ncbi:hypothetical protein AT746_19160 [Lacimicrobium alkaliphilum]|uniref:Disulfide bond formation protein B n=2 Tax=Lacimicrobium alkaliphilum TaxID=1526571 RepID=A0A0U2ZPF6_9ALTE|nr:hypothetical protein AT746_19160 [Lacimicrobium alkaliphilum]